MQMFTLFAISFCLLLHFGTPAFVKPAVSNAYPKCFSQQGDFVTFCQQQLFGFTDGGRCFFFSDINKDWASSWPSCRSYGATLAQIHTASEYGKISDYARGMFGAASWMALQVPIADHTTGSTPCPIVASTTKWYANETALDPLLQMDKTWLYRAHKCDSGDGGFEPAPRCIIMFQYAGYGWNSLRIGDWICPSPAAYTTLCVISNEVQNFTQSPGGVCMNESPVQTVAGSQPLDCADACSEQSLWCRSFNVISGSGIQCQLFSWSITDTTQTTINPQCEHYNYVP